MAVEALPTVEVDSTRDPSSRNTGSTGSSDSRQEVPVDALGSVTGPWAQNNASRSEHGGGVPRGASAGKRSFTAPYEEDDGDEDEEEEEEEHAGARAAGGGGDGRGADVLSAFAAFASAQSSSVASAFELDDGPGDNDDADADAGWGAYKGDPSPNES